MKKDRSHNSPQLRLLRRLRSRFARMRHFRGHGVHSPYIYSLVRDVFMRRTLISGGETRLFAELERMVVCGRRGAVELQNIYTHCGYSSYVVDPLAEGALADMAICTCALTIGQIEVIYNRSQLSGTTIVVESPHSDVDRERACMQIVARHRSTTIDKGQYLIIFNNHLPKQHFQL